MTRMSWIQSSLIFFVSALWCIQSGGATNNSSGFETPPPQVGSIKWQEIQTTARQRQELYRKRVAIPGAVTGNVQAANNALFAKRPEVAMASTRASSVSIGTLYRSFFLLVIFVLGGVRIIQVFFPEVITGFNQWLNPWATASVAELEIMAKVRAAEEESYTRFLAKFQVGPAAPPHADSLEKENRFKEFYARTANCLGIQKKLLQDLSKELNGPLRRKMLMDLYLEMGALKNEAGFPELLPIWQVTFALEGLLKQLIGEMKNITPSALRTIAGGLDLLKDLCTPGLKADILANHPLKFLVVDDNLISRRALSLALNKAFGQPDTAMDGQTALAQAGQHAYDVIFLDVQMPGMDGFEVCTKIHETTLNRATPVVFVTVLSDFAARAESTLVGGSDFMEKPFLVFEVTVKAFTLALRGRLQKVQKSGQSRNATAASSQKMFADRAYPVAGSEIITRPPLSAATVETDGIAAAFLNRTSKKLGPLRELFQAILQSPDRETQQNMLADGFLLINSLVSHNGRVMHPAHLVCFTLEGLLKKLLEDPKRFTPSALITAATAVDLLQDLCVPGLRADLAVNPPIRMLVVDDDLISRRAITGALQTVFNKPENAKDGESALAMAIEKSFDTIFLDVKMPGMDGFEVCSKIHDTVPNRDTPVVFVTGMSDFDSHAEISRNGGADLMGKPFLTAEITVKALTFVLRGRLNRLKEQPALTTG